MIKMIKSQEVTSQHPTAAYLQANFFYNMIQSMQLLQTRALSPVLYHWYDPMSDPKSLSFEG